MYDIGMVYRKGKRYYLAVDTQKLLTFINGKPIACRSKTGLKKVLSISVKELCQQWKISIDYLDKVGRFYLLEGKGVNKKKEDTPKEEMLCI